MNNLWGFLNNTNKTKKCHNIVSNTKGATAIEFAIAAPVLFMFTFGILETSTVMFAKGVLESSVSSASRMGKTGFVAEGMSREEYIQQMVKQKAAGLLKPEKLAIKTKTYESFDNIGKPEPCNDVNGNGSCEVSEYQDINGNGKWDADMGSAGLGGAGDIVVYTVTYPWQIMTPIIQSFIGENGKYDISSSIVVRNEPYDVN